MYNYTKKEVQKIIQKSVMGIAEVRLTLLTAEDIAQYNKDFDDTKFKPKPNILCKSRPLVKPIITKKFKSHKKRKGVLKLVLSREGETDKFKSKFKCNPELPKDQSQEATSTVVSKDLEKVENVTDENKCVENNENDKNEHLENNHVEVNHVEDNHAEDNHVEDNHAEDNHAEDNHVEDNHVEANHVEDKHDDNVGDENICKENIEAPKYIKVRDAKALIDESKYNTYVYLFMDNVHKTVSNEDKIKKKTVNATLLNILSAGRVKLSLSEIENLYIKYFSKTIQDTIVVIASILNIISISNIHHKARMDESFKKRTEAEKLKERVDANRMHSRHKKILEVKLKKHFTDVVSSFEDSEFEHAFQMFFLSILTVLRVLDPPKFKKGSIFKNLVLLLWNSLKSVEYEHPKVFGMFKDKKFRPACIELISLIEDSRDSDSRITDRMSIFFLSAVNDREHFQAVINAVTGDSNDDLGLLIDNAASQCYINSKFKDPVKKRTFTPLTISTTASIYKRDDNIHWVIAKGPNGNYQPIPVNSDIRPPKTAKMTMDSSKVGHQINSYYENFSGSLSTPTVSSESYVTKVIASKLNGVTTTLANSSMASILNAVASSGLANGTMTPKLNVVASSGLANGTNAPKLNVVASSGLANGTNAPKLNVVASPLANGTNAPKLNVVASPNLTNISKSQSSPIMAFKSAIQNIKSIPATAIQKSNDGSTFFLGNKQFQLIRGPIRAAVSQNNSNVVFKTPLPPKPIVSDILCCAKNCNSKATIMCSTCTSVKYCSHNCQREDWYNSHINHCQKLKSLLPK